ncbi:protein trichome birefringence-like 2 [Neltuma alba]|uniref:protein trichome birefringence-like 2 n=1 Tax=Neltuma alba TaxID=207710 RepID=UPI0010A49E29|nr:protein trichome birefringence-like 2 [Prosopis alba]
MDSSKKLVFSEPFLSQRRKVVSGFSLGVVASLLIFTLIFLDHSLNPKVQGFLQGLDNDGSNSSFPSLPFSFSSSSSASNVSVNSGQNSEEGSVRVGKTGEVNVPQTNPLEENLTENYKNASLHSEEPKVQQEEIHETNGTLGSEKANILDSLSTRPENTSQAGQDVNLIGSGRGTHASTSLFDKANKETQKFPAPESPKNANFSAENNSMDNASVIAKDSHAEKMKISFYENCNIFDGKWVRDYSKPYYPMGSCPHIDRDFNCHINGRPDGDYVKWKWQPNDCDIPSLNATDFLERLRGGKLVFVGDSLNRNMWESLVCILRQSIPNKKRVYEISGKTQFKKKGVYAFRFEDYNCTVDFVGSPFLVRESTYQGKNGSFETLRLDLMDQTTHTYHDADIIVFNTGHWWTHEKTSRGEDYYQEGDVVHPRLKVLDAYTRALTTWARWIGRNIDAERTQVFFRGYSPTHFKGGQWNSGGQCHRETEPIYNEAFLQKYPSKMRALDHVLRKMKTPVTYLNISRLTDYRKDGHPSIYRMEYKTAHERNSAEQHQDCSHWCLPGVPDTWNELLYASLLKNGKGTWKRTN